MTAVFTDYLPILIVALVIGTITGFLLFRPRQRVRLSDSAPIRPHMSVEQRRPVADAIPTSRKHPGPLDGAAGAFEDVSGTILNAKVHADLAEAADNLQRQTDLSRRQAFSLMFVVQPTVSRLGAWPKNLLDSQRSFNDTLSRLTVGCTFLFLRSFRCHRHYIQT